MAKSFALSMASMHAFDEELTKEVDQLLQLLANDCKSRPTVTGARKLTMTWELRPNLADKEDVTITPGVSPHIPGGGVHDSRRARISKSNQLLMDFLEEAGE